MDLVEFKLEDGSSVLIETESVSGRPVTRRRSRLMTTRTMKAPIPTASPASTAPVPAVKLTCGP